MSTYGIVWPVVGAVVGVLVGAGFSVLSLTPPDFRIARACFGLAAALLAGTAAAWTCSTDAPLALVTAVTVTIALAVAILLPLGFRWIRRREALLAGEVGDFPCVTLSVVKSGDPNTPAIAVIAHNLTDFPAEKLIAVIAFPRSQIRAHIRCESPVVKGHPETAEVLFSMNRENRVPADGLTTILAMARREEQTRLGRDWARLRNIGPASEADRSVIFDVKYQDAKRRPGVRKHVLKYTLFNEHQVSISPL